MNDKLTYRRLQVLIDHLPPESMFKTAMRDNLTPEQEAEIAATTEEASTEKIKHGPWSSSNMLIALCVDELRRLFWLLHAVNADSKHQMKPPEPLMRPGVGRSGDSPALAKRKVEHLQLLIKHRGKPPKEEG